MADLLQNLLVLLNQTGLQNRSEKHSPSELKMRDQKLYQFLKRLLDSSEQLNSQVGSISASSNSNVVTNNTTIIQQLLSGGDSSGSDDGGIVVPGPQGPQGNTGAAGVTTILSIPIAGLDGIDGEEGLPIPGAQGNPGADGSITIISSPIQGIDGIDGEDAIPIPGPIGATGASGSPGSITIISQPLQGLDGIDGDDGFPIPGARGADGTTPAGLFIVLEEHTASSSATIDFTTRNAAGQSGATFQSDYDVYWFMFLGFLPATSADDAWMIMGTGAGPTWDTGANYTWAYSQTSQLPNSAILGSDTGPVRTHIKIAHSLGNSSTDGTSGDLWLYDPLNTAQHKRINVKLTQLDSAGNYINGQCSAQYRSTTALTGVRFQFSTGNAASGIIRCLGIPK